MELSSTQLHAIMKRFPLFELSYETITHKKVLPVSYEMCLAVPSGRKHFLWFTFYKDQDVCYLMELNKDKRVVKATVVSTSFVPACSIGTVLYGTLVKEDSVPFFIIEDIYYYKGIPLKQQTFYRRLCFLKQLFEIDQIANYPNLHTLEVSNKLPIYLPFFWISKSPNEITEQHITTSVPEFISAKLFYSIHHIQYRNLYQILPYVNIPIGLKDGIVADSIPKPLSNNSDFVSKYVLDYKKPQYRYPTLFQVMADVQYDIYHLYAAGLNGAFVYYDVAYIPNYKKSVFMNGLFRNIRENRNLDYIEESDDEEEFENMREDKYVDLKKKLVIECSFHTKFKRWVPIRVMSPRDKVIHIYKLAT